MTGGHAFPVPHCIDGNWVPEPQPQYCGMTLRDYFAAKAMAAFIAADMSQWPELEGAGVSISSAAYEMADAMLAQRSKT